MSPEPPRRRVAAIGQVVASATILVGTALPWVYSGERPIDLYEMRRIAYRLEADVNLRLVDLVTFVPLVLAVSLLARWAGRTLASRLLALAAAAFTGLGAALIIRSPLPTGAGVVVTALGALALVGVVAIEWIGGRVRSAPPASDRAQDVTTSQDADGSARHR